ncbi:DUF4360 domain-containing protein [Iningainema tapete]|uniref:DUF4360 domain-containing protein n=1 Tax=Iningainema tapete BLCC-T55 TaxID=2748662 RepID=A0A8J7C0C2_9CYAN|nr:DUF4360 domain-containing protein [Iningainema tapete]MBD2777768.1 DUF4360 domain-containing protein [Iningainema tapete BLCC-T55]
MNVKTKRLWQMSVLTSAALLGLNQPLPSLAQQSEAPPEGSVRIVGFAYGGTGCPQGSVGSVISRDQSTIELLYDRFVAELGTGASRSSQSNCTVSFQLEYPAGFSVSWDRVEHRGFADTTGGAQAELRARYYIPGEGGFDTVRVYSFPDNSAEDYTIVQDNISTAFTQCGATIPLSVNTRVRLFGTPSNFNTLTVDSMTNKVRTLLNLRWRRCS